MPWKVENPMSLRFKFVCRLEDGEKMTDLCREFDISRKTGYKIYNRFKEVGLKGLEDEGRRPTRLANLLDSDLAKVILRMKREKSTWGARKLREILVRKYPGTKPPAISTIHALLDRHDLVIHPRKRNTFKSKGTHLSTPLRSNDLWCTDFKGQFRMGDKSLCYPLTITDQVSRSILGLDAMEKISEIDTIDSFKDTFREYGLPIAIRSDNGTPFASRGLFGLSKLSVFWLRLGIRFERIVPGNPQQNGRHERMHRTLKLWTHPAKNILSQQEQFDIFKKEFNFERPHEALKMKTPSELYKSSSLSYPEIIPDIDYSDMELVCKVSKCGSACFPRLLGRISIGLPLAGQRIGAKRIDDKLWELCFMDYKLGFVDEESLKFTAGKNPFTQEN